MKKALLQTLTVSLGIVLTTGLSNGQSDSSPTPATNHVAVAGLNISLAEMAATVRQLGEDASKGFDPAKHAQNLRQRINEILATLPPPTPSEPTNAAPVSAPVKVTPAAGQTALVTAVPGGTAQEPGRDTGEVVGAKPAPAANLLRDAMGELESSVRRLKTHVDQLSERAERMTR